MSSVEGTGDAPELKGGHAPAVKAGGMRITQHKSPQQELAKKQPEKMSPEDEEEFPEESPPKTSAVVISGVVTKGHKDFPPQAVKATHTKPLPTHDARPHSMPQQHIQQPRK